MLTVIKIHIIYTFARPLAKAKQVAEREINNTNVREAIVRPKGDKNINQQLIARKTTHCALRGIEGIGINNPSAGECAWVGVKCRGGFTFC